MFGVLYMGDFLNAAYLILSENNKPLSAKEIVISAIEKGILKTKGKTPAQTMKSKLSCDILQNKTKTLFMRTEAGKFALREWKDVFPEHLAPRFKKSLFDEDIIVFPASYLKRYISKVGLNVANVEAAKQLLLECTPMRRRLAEEDSTVIQLVSFYIVRYNNLYLTYKRTKRLPESRLHNYYSIGFGGHLNPDDNLPLFNLADPEQAIQFIHRELKEELILKKEPSISFRGLIYDDSQEVSKLHLGLVYDVLLKTPDYNIGERGFLMDPKFETIDEIMKRLKDFENWSALIAKEDCGRC